MHCYFDNKQELFFFTALQNMQQGGRYTNGIDSLAVIVRSNQESQVPDELFGFDVNF